ncbi:MAG: hypothetical protein WAK93_20955 [Solirubrobacteraceae bacterium]
MDLVYALRDLGVADPATDSSGEETVRAALAQEIDKATAARRPGRARRTRPRLLAGATSAVVASATAVVLLLSATASPPPAFAVTRHHDGSVSVKINRRTSIADVNRKLAAMGIERIGRRGRAAGEDLSSIPSCSSIPPGWKGQWVQMAGSSSGPGYSISETVPPGTWVLVMCTAGTPGFTGPANTGRQ